MKCRTLVEILRRIGRKRGITVTFNRERGKGSHGTLYFGDKRTTIPDLKKELKTGTLKAILKQLGLTKKDLE